MSFKEKNDVEIIQVDTIPVNLLLHTEKIPIYRKRWKVKIFSHVKRWSFRRIFAKWFGDGSTIFERNGCGTSTAIADGLYEQITTNKEFEKEMI